MRVLLDTHTLLWWVLGTSDLSAVARRLLSDPATTVVVSAVSGHEIATKFRLGKLAVPIRLAEHLDQVAAESGWEALPLSIAHGQLAGGLPRPHRDPFDRMLAAQSLIKGMPVVTNDVAIAGFGVRILW